MLNNQGPILLHDLVAMADEGEDVRNTLDDLAPHLPVRASDLLIGEDEDDTGVPSTLNTPLVRVQSQTPLMGRQEAAHSSGDPDSPQLPGYTTKDDAGADGDDTVHQPIKFYNVPNCIGANVHFPAADDAPPPEQVNVVYNEFIQKWILLALQYLGEPREVADTKSAVGGKSMTDVLSDWVGEHWGCESEDLVQ
jgi:hypothetical protein